MEASASATPSATPAATPAVTTPSASTQPSTPSSSVKSDYVPTSAQAPAEGAAQPSTGETPEQEAVRRFKVTIDGAESEVDETELIKGYQRARAANQRFEEAARLRRQADQLIQTLQQDPLSLLTNPKLGINFDEIAEKHLLAKLENEMLSPEERAQRETQRKLEKYEARERERQEAEQLRHFEAAKSQARADYERRFVEVLEKTNLPRTGDAVARMARYLQEGIRRGMEPDLYDVAALVKEDMLAEQRSLIGSAGEDQLEALLGNETIEKIRKSLLAKVSGAPGAPKETTTKAPREQAPSGMDPFEWREYIRRRAGI